MATKERLTDTTIRNAKRRDKTYRLTDGGGLYLLVNSDAKVALWWRWDYSRPGSGKRNTLSFGTYPDTGLKDAREKHDEARKLRAKGIDPGEQRKAQKVAGKDRAANSFEVVAREWLKLQTSALAKSSSNKILGRLENDVFPWLGARPIADITAPELLKVLRRIEERGAIEDRPPHDAPLPACFPLCHRNRARRTQSCR